MRLTWLFVVGISAVACKDPPAKPADQKSPSRGPATPGSRAPSLAPAPRAPVPPTLRIDDSFQTESRDAAWAAMAEKSIHAVAPHLTEVSCRSLQCRVTLLAPTEQAMMDATEQLQREDSVRGIDGVQAVILTAPEQRDGQLAMKIYVRFNRE